MTQPTFFVVGAARAGTTTLYDHLRSNPHVFASDIKEPHFFCCGFGDKCAGSPASHLFSRGTHAAVVSSQTEYGRLFAHAAGRPAGECTPYYLCHPRVASRIKSALPDARIVVLLRDPVERSHSEHAMNTGIGRTTEPYIKALIREAARPGATLACGILGGSLYATHVKRYFDLFGRDRVLVLLTHEMSRDRTALNSLWAFLGVAGEKTSDPRLHANAAQQPRAGSLNKLLFSTGLKAFGSTITPARVKPAIRRMYYRPRPAKLTRGDRLAALRYFRDDVNQLEKLICRDLSAWQN